MKVGSLIRVRHRRDDNGKIGILLAIRKRAGFRDSYIVRIPSLNYAIELSIGQCEVIGESR